MKARRYSNQSKEQIIGHLSNILNEKLVYTLTVDPLGVHYTLRESRKRKKGASTKKIKLKEEQKGMSKKQRKKSNTKKRTKPKIRTVKKGRTVKLKGRTY